MDNALYNKDGTTDESLKQKCLQFIKTVIRITNVICIR